MVTLHEDLRTLMIILYIAEFLLESEIFQIEIVEKIKIALSC